MIDRNRMLSDLTAAMRRHHRRRRMRRRVTGTLALAVVAAGAVLVATPGPRPQTAPPHATASAVTVVRDSPRTGLIRTIDDKELLDRLAEIARPTGLIRSGDAAWLTDPPV